MAFDLLTTQDQEIQATPAMSAASIDTVAAKASVEAQATGSSVVLSSCIPWPAGDPLQHLAATSACPSVYWRTPSGFEIAGLGAVYRISVTPDHSGVGAVDQAADFLRTRVTTVGHPTALPPRFLGGLAFDPAEKAPPLWGNGGFTSAVFVLPEVTFIRRGDECFLICAVDVTPGMTASQAVKILDGMRRKHSRPVGIPADVALPSVVECEEASRVSWTDSVRHALSQIGSGKLEKVVLSRRRRMEFREATDPWLVLSSLRDADSDCYQFGFRWNEHAAFVGSTPERLFHVEGRAIESVCMAGTIRRGENPDSDAALATQLLVSVKDRLEHSYVVEATLDDLSILCENLTTSPEPRIVRLATLQHLSSPITGLLKEGITAGAVIRQLHPTPAVGGCPRDAALDLLRKLEGESRGWYAGPVGWVGADGAEFAVAIRSALLDGSGAWVFAGAGIVDGSIPENEWHETEDKLQAFARALS